MAMMPLARLDRASWSVRFDIAHRCFDALIVAADARGVGRAQVQLAAQLLKRIEVGTREELGFLPPNLFASLRNSVVKRVQASPRGRSL
jgi:hypothetical protein